MPASDSGGPLVSRNSAGQYTMAGVVSRGVACGLTDFPGLYANIRHPPYLAWAKNTEAVVGCKDPVFIDQSPSTEPGDSLIFFLLPQQRLQEHKTGQALMLDVLPPTTGLSGSMGGRVLTGASDRFWKRPPGVSPVGSLLGITPVGITPGVSPVNSPGKLSPVKLCPGRRMGQHTMGYLSLKPHSTGIFTPIVSATGGHSRTSTHRPVPPVSSVQVSVLDLGSNNTPEEEARR
ncbi:Serine protease 29-like [Homarus americanus]|uniref:Serine protease 29-like n=1 Tax=Homarus americanus TaxID=6706 RepID=A0A8J5NBM2_HOMAM|nr:Serine protease 29-like [Homarus americanus]